MTTFWAVFGGVMAANITLALVTFTLMRIKAVRNWIIKLCIDYGEESADLMLERFES